LKLNNWSSIKGRRMSIVVVGSVALDSVKTPFGEVREVLGGSATYFSTSASFFTDVKLVAVVGEDFPLSYVKLLESRAIDLSGLQKRPGKTFRWKGEYGYDLNEAITLDTKLNVFENFTPVIPKEYKNTDYVFLANIDPELQSKVLKSIENPKLVALDTMNFWIKGRPMELKEVLADIDILIINDAETREFAKEPNIVRAAQKILKLGPKMIIVKRGEYGALMFSDSSIFAAPAYPLHSINDPTGAGDTFAGGFLGYIASIDRFDESAIRQGIIFGSVMASFACEDFSLNRLISLTMDEIKERFREFKRLSHFDDLHEAFGK